MIYMAGLESFASGRARFAEILNGEDRDFPTIMRKITSFAQVLSIAAETMTPIRKNPRLVGWEKPPHGFAKLNINGNYQGGIRSTGFSGLIKNDDGHWILVFLRNSGDSLVLHAELMTIMHGLRLARFISINQLVCHSNSKMAVDLIRTSVDEYHHYASLVGDIRELLNENWVVIIEHTFREANSCANWLDKDRAMNLLAFC